MGPQFGVFKIWANQLEAVCVDENGLDPKSHLGFAPKEQNDIGKSFYPCDSFFLVK